MDDELEVQQAEDLIREVSLPEQIERVEVKAGLDWGGDPALKVVLWVKSSLSYDTETATLLNGAAQEVQRKLLHSQLSRYPFVTLDQMA